MRLIIALGCLLLIAGCATVDVTKTAKGYYEPTNPNQVEILFTKPDRPFTEIGSISASKFPPGQTAKMHNSLRAKSAPLGANAVLITNSGIDGDGYHWVTGVAIRVGN